MSDHLPPSWADALLQLALRPADREPISGDLLEEYRERIVPLRGRAYADSWYVVRVFGYVWRATGFWALAFSAMFLTRSAYDWLVPTTDFMTRSTITTTAAAVTLSITGFRAAWRTQSVVAGTLLTVLTSQVAAVISVIGVTLMLIVWYDETTLRAIKGSGGLSEEFVLPFMMIIPALVLGATGGVCGSLTRRMFYRY